MEKKMMEKTNEKNELKRGNIAFVEVRGRVRIRVKIRILPGIEQVRVKT